MSMNRRPSWSIIVILPLLLLNIGYDTVSAATSANPPTTTIEPLSQIKVGMLFPEGNPDYQSLYGYSSSASAVTIALDRITSEQLLPNINITYVYIFIKR